MKTKNKREELMLEVIEKLVIERNKWEYKAKHPLPTDWRLGEIDYLGNYRYKD